jgi:hypothetical protein
VAVHIVAEGNPGLIFAIRFVVCKVRYGWTLWNAQAMKRAWTNVILMAGVNTIAGIERMQLLVVMWTVYARAMLSYKVWICLINLPSHFIRL